MTKTEIEITVVLAPAIQRFYDIFRIFREQNLPVPSDLKDGWKRLMRIHERAQAELMLWRAR